MVAWYADLQLLQILADANPKNIDIDARDEDGFTALEIPQQRENAPESFSEGFEATGGKPTKCND
jgi:hypothetical protein